MSGASFASLGPTLLARKGGAKPAMRRQLGPLDESQFEDLGWNDMGDDDVALPQSAPEADDNSAGETSAEVVSINQALNDRPAHEQVDLEQQLIKATPEQKNSSAKPQKLVKKRAKNPAKTSVQAAGHATKNSPRRAAFTLRLDPERHLKLRLAATMHGVSAQALVTEALDTMLGEIDNLDTLVQSMMNRMKRGPV